MSALYDLYKLHKVDSALHSLRQEAAGLDTGQEEQAAIKRLSGESSEVLGHARQVSQEIRDLELQQKGYAEKVKGFEKKLYDGSVVSPKEVENIEKEIAMLKGLIDRGDERLLELYEESPTATSEAQGAQKQIDELNAAIARKRELAVQRHAEIKTEFEKLKTSRPALAAEVEKDLLARYEDVRKRTGSTGMAEVTEDMRCSMCGMAVPERQSKALDDDRLVFCEGCQRILFKVVPES
jgi:predicted  nucleic acid-binding Zn-ribbon protein